MTSLAKAQTVGEPEAGSTEVVSDEGIPEDESSPSRDGEEQESAEGNDGATAEAEPQAIPEASEEEVGAAEKTPEEVSAPSDEDGWMNLEASSATLEEKPPAPKPYFRTMLLVEGAARYGAVTIAPPGATLEEEDPDAFESRVGNFGGQVTLGVMPGGSAFTMAGRLRAGSYVSSEFTRGNVAAEMLFGANFARNARGNEFTYILGGFGVEFLPGENQDILTLNVGAATVVKGVSFGGGILVGANDEIAIGTIGMQIGWGQLF